MAKAARVVKEGVDPRLISPKNLTNDCYFVCRADGTVDIARAGKMVEVFDTYHDLGIVLSRIAHAGGRLNSRFQEPNL
jgi:hypothetical protein